MPAGDATVVQDSNPRSDDAFQRLLLKFSAAAAEGTSAPALIRLFCQSARQFFRVDGAYFWQCVSGGEVVGAEADGLMADRFKGTRLKSSESAVAIAIEAIRKRKTLYENRLDPAHYRMAAEFRALSIMAAPLVVGNETVGAATFLHCADADFFNDDLAAKATILAGQLGSLLEARRLTQVSREEHRRTEILAQVAQALRSAPESAAVVEAVADRLRVLLRTRLVCMLLREGSGYSLRAVAAESPQLAASVRSRHDRRGLQFAADLASRAVAAGEPISVAIDPATHALGDLVPPGMLIAAPFRTSIAQGAVLVYPRQEGVFTAEEKSLVAVVTGFGAVAIANAELCNTAQAQAHELHQLLDISAELGSIGQLDEFLQRFALRAADFLGFGRGFIGLLEDGAFRVRWAAENSRAQRVDFVLPSGPASRALLAKEVFWSDDPAAVPGINLDVLINFEVRQLLTVPLLATNGEVLGMFGVLDRQNSARISQEDVRRARALAAQVAVALEVTRNLHQSEEHRKRAESLTRLALELKSHLRLPEFARSFATRAADILGAHRVALAVQQGTGLETLVLLGNDREEIRDQTQLRRFTHALEEALARQEGAVVSANAAELFGSALASEICGGDCTLVRLLGASGELVGVLCLDGRVQPLPDGDEQILQAIAGHAAVALENARLFTRMDQANRHWIEIFDAISDFIVAHDELGNVLRVNRSLADFIGAAPQDLIGVNMSALLAMGTAPPMRSCPFCRTGEGDDEYVHPVLERTYLVSTSRVHGASSEGMQTIHVLKDISDRREVEQRYRELFDNIQEGLFFSTPDGRFIEVNDALVRMLGYANREELLQADVRTQIYFSPERHQELARQMQQFGVVRNHEETLRRRDGSIVYVLINAFAVRDSQGRIVQYRGLMLDISGLKNFQSELQRERDFSGKILNNTQSLILVADTAGLISYANRRWQDMGYEQKELLGKPLEDLVAPTRRSTLSEAFAATLAGRQVDNLDLQILRGDGRIGHFSVNLSPMRDEQSQVTSLVVVMTDVTDAASLQSKLMHAEKMAAVGQLVSGVAHEVNNPLTAILGFADLLMENPEVPESARKDLRVILQEAQRTKQIVQNLLSFARQMPPQRKALQLNPILRRTVQLRSYDFQSHGVEVVEHLDQELPSVVGDSHQLQQVFLNILNNAYDAVSEVGRAARIEIATTRKGNSVEISFRDNGPGISHPDRIFDPFFTTKEVGKGTGLGLSICYGIVHEHGGEILCQNNSGGQGATFVVSLPAAPETASVGAAAGVIQR
ncbi:MAG TPA: PAS domain S-box protein [Terriglobales bacterium]|jgi:two-component system NtrC family sensor kinase|nr:PAS domain S-box protein [Terriglobales bacterium]